MPEAKTIDSGPQDFAYQPASLSDGKAEVRIPRSYSDDVSAVGAFDDNDELLAELIYAGRDKHGRSIFRADRPGSDFGESITLRLHFREGDNYGLRFDPREYQQVSYAPGA